MITCCYENHTCIPDWTMMQHRVYAEAKWELIAYKTTYEKIRLRQNDILAQANVYF